MFRYVVCCSACHLTTCSLLRLYSVIDGWIKCHKAWWNDKNTCWLSSEGGMVQGEITCKCGRNYTDEMGRRLGKRSKKQKYTLKEQHFDKSKSVLHAREDGHKSDWTRASILRPEPSATYSKYKWLTCYAPAILLVAPVWRYLLFGSL